MSEIEHLNDGTSKYHRLVCVYMHTLHIHMRVIITIEPNSLCAHTDVSLYSIGVHTASPSCTHRFDNFCQNHMNENQ